MLDLDGSAPGSIFQNITTTPGQAYRLSFRWAANDCATNGPNPRQAKVQWNGGDLTPTLSASAPGGTGGLVWHKAAYTVSGAASSASTSLGFLSLNTFGASGIVIDNVSVTPIGSTAAPINGNPPFLYRAQPGGAGGIVIDGILWDSVVSGTYSIELRTASTCAATQSAASAPNATISVTSDASGTSVISAKPTTITAGSGLTYISGRQVAPHLSPFGPCIVVTDANDTWQNATLVDAEFEHDTATSTTTADRAGTSSRSPRGAPSR